MCAHVHTWICIETVVVLRLQLAPTTGTLKLSAAAPGDDVPAGHIKLAVPKHVCALLRSLAAPRARSAHQDFSAAQLPLSEKRLLEQAAGFPSTQPHVS